MAIEGVKIDPKQQAYLDEHFGGVTPDWNSFHKKLRNTNFTQAVKEDTRSNDKLKAFVTAVGMREQQKGPSAKAFSDTQGNYQVKYHPEAERFSCSCPDWTYKRSVSGTDCKHIQRMKDRSKERLMSQTKTAMMPAGEVLLRVGNALHRQSKDQQQATQLKAQNQAFQQVFPQRSFIQQWLKEASIPVVLGNVAKSLLK